MTIFVFMILEVKSGDVTIISRFITIEEFNHIPFNGVQWFVDAYHRFFGMDISDYGLNEWKCYPSMDAVDRFVVLIRPDDLIRLRSNKLDLLID